MTPILACGPSIIADYAVTELPTGGGKASEFVLKLNALSDQAATKHGDDEW